MRAPGMQQTPIIEMWQANSSWSIRCHLFVAINKHLNSTRFIQKIKQFSVNIPGPRLYLDHITTGFNPLCGGRLDLMAAWGGEKKPGALSPDYIMPSVKFVPGGDRKRTSPWASLKWANSERLETSSLDSLCDFAPVPIIFHVRLRPHTYNNPTANDPNMWTGDCWLWSEI